MRISDWSSDVCSSDLTTIAEVTDPELRQMIEQLDRNTKEFGVTQFGMGDERQGIVHVIGPELGITQPGLQLVCGDSHTSTHGARDCLAFGVGSSEVAHELATRSIWQRTEEHSFELQSLLRTSSAVFSLTK